MLASEPLARPWLDEHPAARAAAWLLIPAVLWAGFVKNHRQLESRIHARLGELTPWRPTTRAPDRSAFPDNPTGDTAMLKVLVPVDGSANALRAVRHAIAEHQRHHELQVHLLNVQPRFSRHVARYLARADRDAWHKQQADQSLAEARALLDSAGVPQQLHWAVGERAHEICAAAKRLQVHHIVMGTARKNSITRMLEDSVTHEVLETTTVPVEVVAGEAVSRLERWGLPAGALGVGGGLLWLALAD